MMTDVEVVDGEVVNGHPVRTISGAEDALNRVRELEKQVKELQLQVRELEGTVCKLASAMHDFAESRIGSLETDDDNVVSMRIDKPPSVQRQDDEVAYMKSMKEQAAEGQEAIDELRIDPPAGVDVQNVVESWERIKKRLEMGELAFKVLKHDERNSPDSASALSCGTGKPWVIEQVVDGEWIEDERFDTLEQADKECPDEPFYRVVYDLLGALKAVAKKWTPAEFDEAMRLSKGGGY